MYFDAEVPVAENVGGAVARFDVIELKGRDGKPSTPCVDSNPMRDVLQPRGVAGALARKAGAHARV